MAGGVQVALAKGGDQLIYLKRMYVSRLFPFFYVDLTPNRYQYSWSLDLYSLQQIGLILLNQKSQSQRSSLDNSKQC